MQEFHIGHFFRGGLYPYCWMISLIGLRQSCQEWCTWQRIEESSKCSFMVSSKLHTEYDTHHGTPVSINPQTTELVLTVHSLGSYVLAQMTREIFVDCGLWVRVVGLESITRTAHQSNKAGSSGVPSFDDRRTRRRSAC